MHPVIISKVFNNFIKNGIPQEKEPESMKKGINLFIKLRAKSVKSPIHQVNLFVMHNEHQLAMFNQQS